MRAKRPRFVAPTLPNTGFGQFAYSATAFGRSDDGVSVGQSGSVFRSPSVAAARAIIPRLVIKPAAAPTGPILVKTPVNQPAPVLQGQPAPPSIDEFPTRTVGEDEGVTTPNVGLPFPWPTGDTTRPQEVIDVGWSDVFSSVLSTAAPILQSRYGGPGGAIAAPPSYFAAAPGATAESVFGDATVLAPAPSAPPQARALTTMTGDCSSCPSTGPRYAKICLATNEISPLRRRRRRRLFTAGDLRDIASLKAIVGGGAALNAAVVKAIR